MAAAMAISCGMPRQIRLFSDFFSSRLGRYGEHCLLSLLTKTKPVLAWSHLQPQRRDRIVRVQAGQGGEGPAQSSLNKVLVRGLLAVVMS